MSTVKVCDVCGKISEKMAIKVTEDKTKDRPREVWEACTVQCYLQGRKDRESQ